MSDQESVKAALETALQTALSNPKISTLVGALTGTSGLAALMSGINSILGVISITINCVIGFYTIRNLRLRGKILERMDRNGESLKE